MIHFDLPKEQSSILKVIGIGGGGGNAVNHMYSQNIEGVNFIICNTDAQAIAQSNVPNKVQLGPHLTQGLGAGANPEIGRQATEESLEELKSMLEVNTKMAFITAGMGGGTGTGGAPIISKICKDLGILTVGIVTTPFAYEGRKRQLQAEEGIKNMKQYVDTLLVISNDKLRHQFGNLKMREAFAKADNVLATAAKCITDVINSTGQINVDFADVCTVMRNGGRAILGNAAFEGENRAQLAIEEALNSPLLNDNDIRGAKWILININSAEGEHEFTMDEVDTIQNYLLSHAGENTDVILGMGYDNTLEKKIGVTLIATGFEHRDSFYAPMETAKEEPKPEKILMILGEQPVALPSEPVVQVLADPLAPTLVDESPMPQMQDSEQDMSVMHTLFSVQEEDATTEESVVLQLKLKEDEEVSEEKLHLEEQKRKLEDKFEQLRQNILGSSTNKAAASNELPASAASGGYLARPSNIYAESKLEASTSMPAEKPVPEPFATAAEMDLPDMQLVIRNEIPAADAATPTSTQSQIESPVEDSRLGNVADDEKRKSAERLQKLRNLSFNLNAADPNNEFEVVPAYIRRNMELFNTSSTIENFYSNYTIESDGPNGARVSTINTFLDGKKPD